MHPSLFSLASCKVFCKARKQQSCTLSEYFSSKSWLRFLPGGMTQMRQSHSSYAGLLVCFTQGCDAFADRPHW